MTVAYLGQMTVGETVQGARAFANLAGSTLQTLNDTINSAINELGTISSGLAAAVSTLNDAKVAIRIPAVAEFEAQIAAMQATLDGMTVQLNDPATYIAGLVNGVAQVAANIPSFIPPSIAIAGQIVGAELTMAALGLKVDAVDAQLSALDDIATALSSLANLAATVKAQLLATIAGLMAALSSYINLANMFAVGGAYLLHADSTVANIGAELAAALPSSGMGSSVAIQGPVILVQSSNSAGVSAINGVFRVA